MSHQSVWQFFLTRFLYALLLVLLTINPTAYSYYHWLEHSLFNIGLIFSPLFITASLILFVGWYIYLKASWQSLGKSGLWISLASTLLALWWLIYLGLFSIGGWPLLAWLLLILLAFVMTVGLCWPAIRQYISGRNKL